MEFYVELPVLKALLLTAGNNDARTIINGVLVEYSASGIILVSTDWHRMSIARVDYSCEAFRSFIINRAHIEMIKGKQYFPLKILHGQQSPVSIGGISYMPIDGTYPDWRRVLPCGTITGEVATYNPAYIGDLSKARKLLGISPDQCNLEQNGDRGALDRITDDFYVVIMPLRLGDAHIKSSVPDWACNTVQSLPVKEMGKK